MTETPSPSALGNLEPTVRVAMESDLARVVLLDEIGRSQVSRHRGGKAWIGEHGSADDVLRIRKCRNLVVEFCSEVVGFLLAEVLEDPHRGRIMRIERVYVEPDARQIGCGDALVASITQIALETGCTFIEGEALPGDRDTKNLYERAGITARLITVSKALSDLSIAARASR